MAPLTLYAYDMCGLHKQVFFLATPPGGQFVKIIDLLWAFFLACQRLEMDWEGHTYILTHERGSIRSFHLPTYIQIKQRIMKNRYF